MTGHGVSFRRAGTRWEDGVHRMRQGGRRRDVVGVVGKVVVGAAVAAIASSLAGLGFARSAGASTPQAVAPSAAVTWMHGFDAPGTPAQYDKVGVLKIGPARARSEERRGGKEC